MNSLMKILLLSTLLIFIMSSASAVFQDLNIWDENGVRHANRGEDFNIIVDATTAAWSSSSDINSDFNYLIALSYTDSRGTLYLDLNVNVTHDANSIDVNGDGNVITRTLSGSTGPCIDGIDVNLLYLPETPGKDFNTFNIQLTVPLSVPKSGPDINTFIGKPVLVEIWKVADVTAGSTAQCIAKVADGNFIIGPAILVRTPTASRFVTTINQNILIMGFGFEPGKVSPTDNNVEIYIYDANGVGMYDVNYPGDMNIIKGAGTDPLVGTFHKNGGNDTNAYVIDLNSSGFMSGGVIWPAGTRDWNGITVYPDANGEFDVNLVIPYVTATAGSTYGRTDLNTLRAVQANGVGDVNAVFIIAPKISMTADRNAVVTIGGVVYDLNTAMLANRISDLQAVSNFMLRFGLFVNGNTALRQVMVDFNTDVNFGITPILNMGTDFNARSGYVDIDMNKISNGAIDADINMYDVNIGSATIPFILRNGQPCAAALCTNQDGTARTSATAWNYNADEGDGNLSFRVSSFSIYEASPFDIEMVAPLGGEKIRRPRNNGDANYQIQFRFKDLNTADNNVTPLRGVITYATKRGENTGVIFYDANLFDTVGIRCNGWNNIDSSTDLSTWNDCVFDLNRADLNGLVGQFVIDVNIASNTERLHEQSVLTGTDSNVFFNSPLIEITDVNINDGNYVTNRGVSGGGAFGVYDVNYIIDFNIYLPDYNTDQNFTLADYNIHFFLGPTQDSIGVGLGVSDINVLGISQQFDQNFNLVQAGDNNMWDTNKASNYNGVDIRCIAPPVATPYFDYSCTLQYDTNGVFENKNYIIARLVSNQQKSTAYSTVNNVGTPTVVTHIVDFNELWDNNASIYAFSINDSNVPRATFNASGDYSTVTTTVRATTYTATITCDDNTSGVARFFYKEAGGAWIDNGAYNNKVVIRNTSDSTTTKTYYAGCRDYAGLISDINGAIVVTLRPPGSRSDPNTGSPGGPGGTSTTPVIGTETIFIIETQGTPTTETIVSTLGEAGFTVEEIATMTVVAADVSVDQTVTVDKITTVTGATYQTWVSIKVRNTSDKKWRNVRIVVKIPKSIASNASQISSDSSMWVLKADPIIEFLIPEIPVGGTGEIKYSTDKQISDITANALPKGMVVEYAEVAPCDGVTCAPQPCATGACNTTSGVCEYDYKSDGTGCGVGKECMSGTCIDKTVPPTPPPVQPAAPPADYTLPIVAGIIIIVVIVGAAYYIKTKKGKGV